jgi:hypothetical protein
MSLSNGAIGKPSLLAGAGNLLVGLDNGEASGEHSVGFPSETSTCVWDDCIANCECTQDCENMEGMCNFPPQPYYYADWPGMNGVRRCGAFKQSSMGAGSAMDDRAIQAPLSTSQPWFSVQSILSGV